MIVGGLAKLNPESVARAGSRSMPDFQCELIKRVPVCKRWPAIAQQVGLWDRKEPYISNREFCEDQDGRAG